MDLKAIWAVLTRRWYLVILAIACTVGATFLVAVKVGPTYEAQGATLVFPPVATVQRGAETFTQGNPYLALEGVSQARAIVIRELSSKATADDFAEKFPGSTYEATPDVLNNAPIISITVEAPTDSDAISGVADLSQRIPGILNSLQSGLDLDANSTITSRPLTADTRAEALHKDQIRAAVVAAAVTLGLGLLAIALLDGLMTGRRKKKHSANLDESPSANDTFPTRPHRPAPIRGRPDEQPEKVVPVPKTAGAAANRLRPRSPSSTASTASVSGSAHGDAPEVRSSRRGLNGVVEPAQRR